MKLIGPLMKEHRLIERMVALMKEKVNEINKTGDIEPSFVEAVVDFLRTYADRTHHGKEEDILFRELAKKPLSLEHDKMFGELIQEHILGRKLVSNLDSAKENYLRGANDSLQDIKTFLNKLVRFYPMHIEKEDRHFFYPCVEYFNTREQNRMLQEFRDFDQQLIHEKYNKTVDELEKRKE